MIYSHKLVCGLCSMISNTHSFMSDSSAVGMIDEVKQITIVCLIIYWSFLYQTSSGNRCITENDKPPKLPWNPQYYAADTVEAFLLDLRGILRFWLECSEQTNPPLYLCPLRVVKPPEKQTVCSKQSSVKAQCLPCTVTHIPVLGNCAHTGSPWAHSLNAPSGMVWRQH